MQTSHDTEAVSRAPSSDALSARNCLVRLAMVSAASTVSPTPFATQCSHSLNIDRLLPARHLAGHIAPCPNLDSSPTSWSCLR